MRQLVQGNPSKGQPALLQRLLLSSSVLVLAFSCGGAAAAAGGDLPGLALQDYSPVGREAVRAALARGIAPAPGAPVEQSASRFRASGGHETLARMARSMANQAAQQKVLQASLEQANESWRRQAAGSEIADDMAGGLAMLVLTWHSLATGADRMERAAPRLARQLQSALRVQPVARLRDRDKQAVHEWSIGASTMLLMIEQMVRKAGRQDTNHLVAARAGELVADLFSVPIERLVLDEGGLRIGQPIASGSPPPAAPPPSSPPNAPGAPDPSGRPSAPLPEPETGSLGTPQAWQDYVFVAPPGWSTQVGNDGVLLKAPPTQQAGENTFIALMPLRRAEGDLASQAVAVARGFFAQSASRFTSYSYGHDNLLENMERGLTGDGWRFVEVNLSPILLDGRITGSLVRVMLVQLGQQVAPIVAFDNGIRLDNPVSGKGVWPLFFFGLAFPRRQGPGPDAIYDQLAGTWGVGGGNSMVQETYGKDGSYGSAAGYQTYHDISRTQVLERTHGFFGEGRYVVHGNRLTVWERGGKPTTHYFRIAEQANSAVASGWIWKFRRLNRSVEGQDYELSLTRR